MGRQKSLALINDFTGYGRCSVSVQLPIISMLRVQCSVIPTSIYSNHTGPISSGQPILILIYWVTVV